MKIEKSEIDRKFQDWLDEYASEQGKSTDEFVKEFDKEIKNRRDTLPKLKEILEQRPIDLEKFREACKQNYTLFDHWVISGMEGIWKHEKSQDIFNRFLIDFPESETEISKRIDEFVNSIVELTKDKPKNKKIQKAGAKILASVILSSLYPDRFVDYRKNRWKKLANEIGINAFTDKESNEIIEAAKIAKLITETSTFQKYWSNEMPLQTVAAICWVGKDRKISQNGLEKDAKRILEDEFELAIDIDVVKRILRHLNAGKHVVLVGAPGVGKTQLAKRILRIHGKEITGNEYLSSVASAEWTRKDVIGSINLENEFVPGFVTSAVKNGKWLLIDEFNRADINKAFGEMFLAIEDESIPLKEEEKKGEFKSGIISIPDDFRMICTMNDFDKNLLLTELSYGLITRFAFVDIIPDKNKEQNSVKDQVLFNEAISEEDYTKCQNQLNAYFGFINKVRDLRMIGVRTSVDIARYVVSSVKEESSEEQSNQYLDEALCDYLLPQFDRLDREVINHVLKTAKNNLTGVDNFVKKIEDKSNQLERISNFLA